MMENTDEIIAFFNLNKSSYNYCSLDEYQVYITLNEIARG